MRPYSKILNGLLPVVLIITGAILRLRNATAFLGLVAFGLAAIALCYRILHLFSCKYKKVIRICSMVLTILLIVGFLVVCVTGAFIGSATSGDRKDDLAYIVVLGAKVNGTAPSRTLRERIDAAADYLHENPNTIAVVSGGTVYLQRTCPAGSCIGADLVGGSGNFHLGKPQLFLGTDPG